MTILLMMRVLQGSIRGKQDTVNRCRRVHIVVFMGGHAKPNGATGALRRVPLRNLLPQDTEPHQPASTEMEC